MEIILQNREVEVIVIKNERHISLLRRYKDLKNDKKD
jgi:hypothetical protein